MKKKKANLHSFLSKLRFQYRVSVLNENTLEESWHVRLSRLSVLVYFSSLILITFILLTLLIIATPVKYYLPGFNEGGNRATIINESMIADSIKNEMELQTGYMNMIRSILLGNMKPDSVEQLDSAKVKEIAHDFSKKTKDEE